MFRLDLGYKQMTQDVHLSTRSRELALALLMILIFSTSVRGDDSFPIVKQKTNHIDSHELLTVSASQDWGELQCRNGFLHGLDVDNSLCDSLVGLLRPRFWRGYKLETYSEAASNDAIITFGPSNHYAWWKGGWKNAKPWLDWDEYESYLLSVIQAIDYYFPEHPPDYYDIWNEPDHTYFWKGTYEQLVETFARSINVIKSYRPNAKVVGPSISWYRPDGYGEENIIDLLIDLDTLYGLRLDAISWHENGGIPDYGPGRPEDIYFDEASIRTEVETYFPPEYDPEYHINEYTGGRVHLSPGWTMAYLFWLDYVRIDFASRACWGILSPDFEYYSDCWAGLDGLFLEDGVTQQPIYWVHRAYAEMDGKTQLPIWTTNANVLMIAARDDDTETLRVLAGRYYDSTSTSVMLEIQEYPYNHDFVQVSLSHIPSFGQFHWDPPVAMPWPHGPNDNGTLILPVSDSQITVVLDDFPAGDVYIVDFSSYTPCGDCDMSGTIDIDDVVYLVVYIFTGGPEPAFYCSGDVDCSSTVDIDDVVWLITFIFSGGSIPCDTDGDGERDC